MAGKTQFTYTAKRGVAIDGNELAAVCMEAADSAASNTNLLTEPDFGNNGANWTLNNWTVANQQASVINNSGGYYDLTQTVTLPTTGTFAVECDVTSYTTGTFSITTTPGTSTTTAKTSLSQTATGKIRKELYVTVAGTQTIIFRAANGTVGTIANLRVYQISATTIGNDASDVYPTGNAASSSSEANATTGWTANNSAVLSSVGSPVHGGSYAISGESNTTPTANAGISFDLDSYCTDGNTYELIVYARHNGTGGGWQLQLSDDVTSTANITRLVSLANTDTTFTEYAVRYTHSAYTQYLVARENNGSNDGGVYLDAITVRETNDIVANGDFYTEAGSAKVWTLDAGVTISNNVVNFSAAAASDDCYQTITLPVAGTYEMSIYVASISSGTIALAGAAGTTALVTSEAEPTRTDVGWLKRKIYCHSPGTASFYIRSKVANTTATVSNATCWLVEDDQSAANDNGFEVHGQLDKVAVSNGSNMYCWTGFDANTYLSQPYTSALDFGSTSDFTISLWVKPYAFSGTDIYFRRGNGTQEVYYLYTSGSSSLVFAIVAGGTSSSATGGALTQNEWNHIVGVRDTSGTYLHIYINGELTVSKSVTARNVSATDAVLSIGAKYDGTSPADAAISAVKIYGSALTASQIKTIYDKEKVLFYDGSVYQVEGQDYTLLTSAHEKTQSFKEIKTTNVALDGTTESNIQRTDRIHDVTTDYIAYDSTPAWREFLHSTRANETFTYRPGGGVEPDREITVSRENTDAQEARQGGSRYIAYSMQLREREDG